MVENTNYKEEEEEEEEVDKVEEVGQGETIKDNVRTIGFYIKVLPIIAQMRREYKGEASEEPTICYSRGYP